MKSRVHKKMELTLRNFFSPLFLRENWQKATKKPPFVGRFFRIALAVPTGKEPVKCNYLPTDYELILSLIRCFSCKDLLILCGVTEAVK